MHRKSLVFMVVFLATFLLSLCPVWAATNGQCCPDGTQGYQNPLQVYVYDVVTDNPVVNAKVEITKGVYDNIDYTGGNGKTGIFTGAKQTGTYTVSVTATGYMPETVPYVISSSQYLCEPILIKVGLKKACESSLQVCVFDKNTNQRVVGAQVTISPFGTKVTGSDGCITINNISPGDYMAIATTTDGRTGDGTITIETDQCKAYYLPIYVDREVCDSALKVYVFDQNGPVFGATVTVSALGIITTTGADGWTPTLGTIPFDSYNVNVSKSGYAPGSGSITIDECRQYELRIGLLHECKSSLKVCVYDKANNSPVAGATVTVSEPVFGTRQYTTGADGCILPISNIASGLYTITAEKAGFLKETSTAEITRDYCGEKLISLGIPSTCNNCVCKNTIQVFVFDADTNEPVSNATVAITGPGSYSVVDYTGSRGQTGIFTGANTSGSYPITVTKSGYARGEDTLIIDKNCGARIIKVMLKPI